MSMRRLGVAWLAACAVLAAAVAEEDGGEDSVAVEVDAGGQGVSVAPQWPPLFPTHPKSVFANKLVRKNINFATVTKWHGMHGEDVVTRRFPGEVLGYVTPWNRCVRGGGMWEGGGALVGGRGAGGGVCVVCRQGYDVAREFAAKFAYVSPVWFQLRDKGDGSVEVTGLHEVNAEWMADVRLRGGCGNATSAEGCPRIVPRFVWESKSASARSLQTAEQALLEVVERYGFDGAVLEIPVQRETTAWITSVATALHKRRNARGAALTCILVLPPLEVDRESKRVLRGVDPAIVVALAKTVDRFSYMTYDFPGSQGARGGPVAPLWWVRDALENIVGSDHVAQGKPDKQRAAARAALARKLLVGLAMYGSDSGKPIVGHEYVKLLEQQRPRIKFGEDSHEHSFTAAGHRVFYPTLYSIHQRANLALEYGAGLAVWELGQGLIFFHDLW
jgi:chitinase domain-containing protein 1